jgi:P-type Cu+ transporter
MQTEFTFALTGLSCGHCVKRLRTLLENQPALRILSLDIRQMQLVADCSAEEIKQLVAQAGYHAELLTPPATGLQQALPKPTRSSSMPKLPKQNMLHLAIEGMTCTQCVATVTRALSSVTGVDSVQVNLAENHAYIDGTPVLADLLTASQNAGYPAKVLTDANRQQQRSIEKKKLRFLFWQAVLALIAAFTIMAWGMTTTATQANFSTHVWYAIALITALLILTTGGHFYLKALRSLKNKTATMDTLVTLSTSIAWIYSTLRLLQPAWFPANTQHYYFEASLMIIGLVNLGQVLEHRARAQASDSLNKLLALTPNEVMVVTAEGDKQLPLQQVTTGMQLRVRLANRYQLMGDFLPAVPPLMKAC